MQWKRWVQSRFGVWLFAVSVTWPLGDSREGCVPQVALRAFSYKPLGSEMCTSPWQSLPKTLGASAWMIKVK